MRMTRRQSGESAFTIVEVIIAVLIITVVLAGAVYYMGGAGRAQGRAATTQKVAAYADKVMQGLQADQAWLDHCEMRRAQCRVGASFVARRFPAPEIEGVSLGTSIDVRSIDSQADGTGARDADRRTDDFYEFVLTIRMHEDGRETTKVYRSTLDAAALGEATGTLVFEACEVTNQIDERMRIPGCHSNGSGSARGVRFLMEKQPEPCTGVGEPLNAEQMRGEEPSRFIMSLDCNDAYDTARRHREERASVEAVPARNLRRVELRWQGGRLSNGRVPQDRVVTGNLQEIKNLNAGEWRLVVSTRNGRELWSSHTIPSDGSLSVQANQSARALVMLRPRQGRGSHLVRFYRTTYTYEIREDIDDSGVMGPMGPSNADGGASVTGRVIKHYIYSSGAPRPDKVAGASWAGLLGMEPKPYDRYRGGVSRQNGNGTPMQQVSIVGMFAPIAEFGRRVDGRQVEGFPTGLHSMPIQHQASGPTGRQPATSAVFGPFGTRIQHCTDGPCRDGYVWIDEQSRSTSWTEYWDKRTGECYMHSSVSGFLIPQPVMQGGPNPRGETGKYAAYRCDQTLTCTWCQYPKSNIAGFFPNRSGAGGGRRVLLYVESSLSCSSSGSGSCSGGGSTTTCPGMPCSPPPITASSPGPTGSSSTVSISSGGSLVSNG